MITFVYIAIFLRLVPLFLQWLSHTRKNVGSLYFLLFTLFSFGADVLGLFFCLSDIHTDVLFNFYQIFETVVATFLAIKIGKFNQKIKFILYLFCFLFGISVVLLSFIHGFDFPQDFNWGISRFYILTITFISALHYVRKMDSFNNINAAPLFGLLGIFIYEAMSIIPILSKQIQLATDNPIETYVIYFIFIASGNLIRDALISYNAVLNIKHKVKWTLMRHSYFRE